MMYIDNPRLVYGVGVELNKVHTQKYKVNMETKKLGVVECLDKDEVACGDEDVVDFLYQGVLE